MKNTNLKFPGLRIALLSLRLRLELDEEDMQVARQEVWGPSLPVEVHLESELQRLGLDQNYEGKVN
jgi:hypothetical protein